MPASGKTTIAHALQDALTQQGISAVILDSDDLRDILTPCASYTPQERDVFYAGLRGFAELLAGQQVNVIIAATGNLRRYRQAAREKLPRFYEIWVHCPAEVCRQRDPKGLYAQADLQKNSTLPGAGAIYEPPIEPCLTINATIQSPAESAACIIRHCALAN